MTETNYAVAPGEYLKEWLNEQHPLTRTTTQLSDIIEGTAPITTDIAAQLEHLTGIPTSSWLRHEATYRSDLERLRTENT
jgi:HTH-type transcriptional regulator/antitoxin HigA